MLLKILLASTRCLVPDHSHIFRHLLWRHSTLSTGFNQRRTTRMAICIRRIWSSCVVEAGYCGSSLCKTVIFPSEPGAWSPPGRKSLEGMLEIKNKPNPTSVRFEPMNTDWNPWQFLLPLPVVVWVSCRRDSSLSQSLTLMLGSAVRCWRKIQGKMGQLLLHINEENPQISNKA